MWVTMFFFLVPMMVYAEPQHATKRVKATFESAVAQALRQDNTYKKISETIESCNRIIARAEEKDKKSKDGWKWHHKLKRFYALARVQKAMARYQERVRLETFIKWSRDVANGCYEIAAYIPEYSFEDFKKHLLTDNPLIGGLNLNGKSQIKLLQEACNELDGMIAGRIVYPKKF